MTKLTSHLWDSPKSASTTLSRVSTGALLCLLCISTAPFTSFSSFAASNDELKGVSAEIARQRSSLSTQQKKLNVLQAELKSYESSIAQLQQSILKIEGDLKQSRSNLNQLNRQKVQLEKDKAKHTETLQELIKTYYVTSKENNLAQIFDNKNAQKKDRISQYFQHLAKARVETINALKNTQKQLDNKERQLVEETERQSTILAQKSSQFKDLQRNQTLRKTTIAKISGNISNNRAHLSELSRNESRLKAEIAQAIKRSEDKARAEALAKAKAKAEAEERAKQLAKANAQASAEAQAQSRADAEAEAKAQASINSQAKVPMNGIARLKGRLPWPLDGKILHPYGTTQSGQVTWKGMVIDARAGQPVKAVYSGKVVFAEWLRGYGFVILLDHGRGDMTLYGYNQTLLKKDGDSVQAGEVIARAGNSGGQSTNSLYFEVRRNSRTQNPKTWLK